jgi:phosphopantothenoylcysteine decarboxylase / phosphopantothenate---cysteine ligase
MSSCFAGKNILVGITGSIAVYKICDWVRSLLEEGAHVTVVMTESATRFVSPLTFAALSGNRVHVNMFDPAVEENIPHISLARRNELVLVAPATSATLSRMANGLAEDLLSTIVLATTSPVVVCPAMNSNMYLHPATQANLNTLQGYGYTIVNPDSGAMACGEEGPGRLPEWDSVLDACAGALSDQDLSGKSVLITAGPTEEPLDPVRFLSNRSSGKMGYALARVASRRGANVTLIVGPTHLPDPPGIKCVHIRNAQAMYNEVVSRFDEADIIVKAAAVSDFRPAQAMAEKIKKQGSDLHLELARNKDILLELGQRNKKAGNSKTLVGFAAESENLLEEGKRKLQDKNLDCIVVNDISADDSGFAVDTNRVTMIDRNGGVKGFPLLSKDDTAERIWDEVIALVEAT